MCSWAANKRSFFSLALFAALLLIAWDAAAKNDVVYETLDSTTFSVPRGSSAVLPSSSGMVMDLSRINTLPLILGNADPISYAQYLPSLSARSELESNLHIQGNDHSHNLVSLGSIPVYGVSHFLGIFSIFNTSHYKKIDFSTFSPWNNRLGGTLDAPIPNDTINKIHGDFSVGMLASQGGVKIPIGKRFTLSASVRRTYINLLYGKFLKIDGTSFRYGFTDANLTLRWTPSRKDDVWFDVFFGSDDLSGLLGNFDVNADATWQNMMAAFHWKRELDSGFRLTQSLYFSGYGIKFDGRWTDATAQMKSHIFSLGYRGTLLKGPWQLKWESIGHEVFPQNPVVSFQGLNSVGKEKLQRAWENILAGRYSASFRSFGIEAGLKGSAFLSPVGQWYWGLDPDVVLSYDFYQYGKLTARVGMQHQYLFQSGLSSIGLPVDFWFCAGSFCPPQWSYGGSLSYHLEWANGVWFAEVEGYYRQMRNQVEYVGNLLSFVIEDYALDKVLSSSRGRAYGVNVSLHKTAGMFTGWLSYAWGRSLRLLNDPSYPEEFPASYERVHEVDAVISFNLGHFSAGLTTVFATGTPFTAPESLYFIGQQVAACYGKHNGRNLAPYFRVDVSFSYLFHRDAKQENGLNLSVYNVTGQRNELMYRLHLEADNGFNYAPARMELRFLPTLSYFHRF